MRKWASITTTGFRHWLKVPYRFRPSNGCDEFDKGCKKNWVGYPYRGDDFRGGGE